MSRWNVVYLRKTLPVGHVHVECGVVPEKDTFMWIFNYYVGILNNNK